MLTEFGLPLTIDAIEHDVIRVLPKLINAAVHRFVGGDLDYVHVLGLFIGKYGLNRKVSEVLLRLLIDKIAANSDMEESVGLAKM
jgi:spore coat polysaccharide biosynthesis protein SpsF (cytidylyltransferase family)